MNRLSAMLCVITVAFSVSIEARELTTEDIGWLNRVTYSVNQQVLVEYQRLGREAYLQKQLAANSAQLPPKVLTVFNSEFVPFDERMGEILDLRAKRNKIGDGDTKANLVKAIADSGKKSVFQARSRHLIRAIYSPNQLREQLVWFWLNHFNVYAPKANIRWQIGDYEDKAIRPYALGKFSDLLKATLTHPAMLTYLDNARSRKGKINENYARELLELHTLGVDAGYSQNDVKEVARILTGVGVNYKSREPRLPENRAMGYINDHGFEFNPARHDYGTKKVLGVSYKGTGWGEVEQLIEQLSKNPATAKHVSKKMAQYFVDDSPSETLIKTMSEKFLTSDGNIAATLAVMFESKEFLESLKSKYRSPTQFVIAAVRHVYERQLIVNYLPVINWISRLSQPLYGYVTPNGYSLASSSWNSSGQLSQRFEIARAIAGKVPKLFTAQEEKEKRKVKPPIFQNSTFKAVYASHLSPNTTKVLSKAQNIPLWNTLFLSSPEWQNREVKK
ncbi:DUF1800 domain-containing protein [Advenella sp. FME57]|uniref:DUF1800 domain-containing protein n=1 Tax=Advenella sp. FME57 TaxID=2742604 RepID=UPI001D028CFF|nr:DUF1800 domain-containing protein [Advenella sp. FME57]